jgi:hypothetical protein
VLVQCVTPVHLDNTAVVNIRDTVLTFGDAHRMAQLCGSLLVGHVGFFVYLK